MTYWTQAGGRFVPQLDLEDLLADEVMQAVMQADHVEAADVRTLFGAIAGRRAGRQSSSLIGRERRSMWACLAVRKADFARTRRCRRRAAI